MKPVEAEELQQLVGERHPERHTNKHGQQPCPQEDCGEAALEEQRGEGPRDECQQQCREHRLTDPAPVPWQLLQPWQTGNPCHVHTR